MRTTLIICSILFSFQHAFSQLMEDEIKTNENLNWYNKDWKNDEILGVGTERAFQEFLKDKTVKKTIVVAVMDSGVDIEHKDFEGKIWINEDEIAGNGIDDDSNGYIDDVHGWNFLGNANGDNVNEENLEYVRIYKAYKKMEANGNAGSVVSGSKEDVAIKKSIKMYEEEIAIRKDNLVAIEEIRASVEVAKGVYKKASNIELNTLDDVIAAAANENEYMKSAVDYLFRMYSRGMNEEGLDNLKEINEKYVNSMLNLDLNARGIVGDDPFDITDVNYGNQDVIGPGADHGTSCAGVIGAVRGNGLGIDGIGGQVKIMALRTTPDGDERDKDVALGIRYAVDNGADIINMSFGKDFSPQKSFVDEAVKYAEENNVLIIHSSGNSGRDIDVEPAYPSPIYLDGTRAKNWLTVGASNNTLDKHVIAPFSNYGNIKVDLLAPGVDVLSLDLKNGYSQNNGTSLSAPVVSGVAALIWSYYPELSIQELMTLLIESSKTKKPKKVYLPGDSDGKKKKFVDVLNEGGIVNVYRAFEMLEERSY